jgi:hypothetical protein
MRASPETGPCCSLYLPLPRLLIGDADVSRPVPALSERQFIVDEERGTEEDERERKALFWYKQELLSRISAAWAEVSWPDRLSVRLTLTLHFDLTFHLCHCSPAH